ncbi:MAG TPA: DUF4105 domain-containing protein [Tepidisphaeraceae bacterium]|jgi:hypothetical protein|nr:DUF4105 domain-containing protein [Tepidisphaeraceae bacterium]
MFVFMESPALKLAIFTLAILLSGLAAQAQKPTQTHGEPGAQLHVYVLTFGPGVDPWEKFGHNAIRIVDDARTDPDRDLAFNWGVFSFDNGVAAFAWDFLQGRLIYSMGISYGQPTIDDYIKRQNRSVYQEELNLTAQQKIELYDKLVGIYNDKSKRFYRYDYYNYNCSSRVRDAVDDLIDHRLAAVTKDVPSGASFRSHTARLTASVPWMYVFVQAALGHPVDHPIDRWQEMFLPEKLHDRLKDVTVHMYGYDVPLVKSDQTLYVSTRPPEPSRPPVMTPWLLMLGVLVGAALAGLGHFARRHWAARWGFILVALPWTLLMGVGGAIILWMWLATDHIVTRYNENVMHVSILALPLIVLVPMLALGKRRGSALAQRLVFAMAGISILGMALKVTPWFYQGNWPIIALCLPVNIALAYAVWVMAQSPLPAKGESTGGKKPVAKGGRKAASGNV